MRLRSGMRQLIKRPLKRSIDRKFKSAIPLYSGDSLLISLLGKIVFRPGLAAPPAQFGNTPEVV